MEPMHTGIVFDIHEFAVHDGPGIRTSVFLKGCPLFCSWCHNPEGQSSQPQVMQRSTGSRITGMEYTSQALADLINRQADILRANEGGVTFSGGEPLQQADFVAEVIERLEGVHVLLDTSGYGAEEDFRRLLAGCQMVYFDLKVMDRAIHQRFTGQPNDLILSNLAVLAGSGAPYVIRVPLVPGVTDTDANLEAIASYTQSLSGMLGVDLLPYNRAAGAKYAAAGMLFNPGYDESQPVNINKACFENKNIQVRVA
jgi:pyruvate formate lyase activating enzyme